MKTYLQNVLLPQLSKGDAVVIDNIAFHKKQSVKLLIEPVGATILFIPPYCPDLNLIEHCWHKVKQNIRKIKHIWIYHQRDFRVVSYLPIYQTNGSYLRLLVLILNSIMDK